jgi:hypothetical protein
MPAGVLGVGEQSLVSAWPMRVLQRRLGICIDYTGNPRHGVPLGVELESVKPSKGRPIRLEASRAERLLSAAEHINGDFGRAEFGEQVGKGVKNHGGDFELGRELDNLSTGTAGDTFRRPFIAPFDAAQHQQRLVHPRHGISVLLIDRRAALCRDRTGEAVDVEHQKAHAGLQYSIAR